MWMQSTGTDAVDAAPSKDKQQQLEDSQTDSGFLSGSNLLSSQLSIDQDEGTDDPKIAPEPANASESGLVFGPSTGLDLPSDKTEEACTLDSGIIDVKSEELISLELESEQEIKDQLEETEVKNNLPLWQVYFAQDDEGDTQLHLSIIQEFTEAAFYLIDLAPHPCLLDILNDDWQSPLHLAVMTKQPRIVRKLILAGANPSIRNFSGDTPLHLACAAGDLNCARALTCPLSSSERSEFGDKQITLLPHDLQQRNYNGKMCLHLATLEGHKDLVRHLQRLGADLEGREALGGYTALHLAIERQKFDFARFLVYECRVRLDTRTYGGLTAYKLARRVDLKFASELVALGGKPSIPPELLSDSDSESDYDEDDEEEEETEQEKAFRESMEKLSMAPKPIVA